MKDQGGDDPGGAKARVASAPTVPLDPDDSPVATDDSPVATDAPPRHEPGHVLGGRYKIVRRIAAGGMGVVYEAEDRELGSRVALKALRAEIARDRRAIERFKREIQLARLVTHPNVCRIFELGLHATDAGAPECFLTMELLDGRTLADRIHEAGRLSADEALAIARQLVAALAAAHEAGVIHRDFKSANVILVGARAVVTDFGLARGSIQGSADSSPGRPPLAADADTPRGPAAASHSSTDALVGTPAYMAPEQIDGGEVGVASDVYALGVVLFEMVTGRLPFVGATPLATAARRLSDPPPSPRSFAPDLDERWERTILRCLARHPRDRFAGARDVLAALEQPPPPTPRPRRRAIFAAAAGVALTAAIAIAAGLASRPSRAPRRDGERRSIAVLPLRAATAKAREAWPRVAATHGVAVALASHRSHRVIQGDAVAEALRDLSLAENDRYTGENLARLRAHLGVDLVALGSYSIDDAGARSIDLRAHDASGSIVARATERGAASDHDVDLGLRAGATLGASRRGERPRPPNPAERALAEAEAAASLGDVDRARSAADRALASIDAFAEVDRPLVHARLLELGGDRSGAVDRWRALHARDPRDAEVLHRLAAGALRAERFDEALAAVDALHALGPPHDADPRVDRIEVEAAFVRNPQRARAAAARAIAAAERREARGVLAAVLTDEAWLAFAEGDLDAASVAAERAKTLNAALDRRDELAESIGALAAIRWQQGKVAESAPLYDEIVALARDVATPRRHAIALNNAGVSRIRLGELDAARARLERALAADAPSYRAPEFGLGWIDALRGDTAAARRAWERVAGALDDEPYVAIYLSIRFGELLLEEGDLEDAAVKLDAARASAERLGIRSLAAEARLAIALLRLREGRPAEAEALARAMIDEFVATHANPERAWAWCVFAEAALALGRADDARAALERAREGDAVHDDLLARLRVAIATAKLAARLAPDDDAARKRSIEALDAAATTARDRGLLALERAALAARARLAPAPR